MARRGASKTTVLLVDDDADYLDFVAIALEKAGFQVLKAFDEETAMQMAQTQRVQVAVLDVIMSNPDAGFRLARAFRRHPRTREMRLLMLSSINQVNRARKLATFSDADRDDMWLPVDRFLDKPCPPERLAGVIREVLSGDGEATRS